MSIEDPLLLKAPSTTHLMNYYQPLSDTYPALAFKNHTLKERDGSRRRCKECYRKLRVMHDRYVATVRSKKVKTYCDECFDQPAFCLGCFQQVHNNKTNINY